MKRNSLKKFSLFPFFIFLIHLPFVFAKSKPDHNQSLLPGKISANISDVITNPIHSSPVSKSFIYDSLKLNTLGLSRQAFDYAVKGYNYLRYMGKLNHDNILSIVDFSLPSSSKRLFVIDMENLKILYNTYVAHGRNSGKEYANKFSNDPKSFKSSLGFFITKETYIGAHGFSLQLEGIEKGINDNAFSRAIVIHSADYVNGNLARSQGYIGRSLGCPALPKKYSKPIIETIKDGSCLFIYGHNNHYLSNSRLLQDAS